MADNDMDKILQQTPLWKYIKNYLRSTMSDSRLNGLALLYVHRDIPLNYDSVIDDFAKGNRRLEF